MCFFLSFLSLAFILNLLNPIDSFLFMEEVVEHLVMATAPPSCINGVYWSHLVCGFKGFAQRSCIVSRNTFAGILIQRVKEEGKSTGTLFFHSSWISFCAISFLCKFVVFKAWSVHHSFFIKSCKLSCSVLWFGKLYMLLCFYNNPSGLNMIL